MTTFTLLVLDETHIILAANRHMPPEEQRAISTAFARWKAEGGVAVIGDCLVKDRNAVEIELDLGDTPRTVERLLEGAPVQDGITDEAVDAFVQSHGGK